MLQMPPNEAIVHGETLFTNYYDMMMLTNQAAGIWKRGIIETLFIP